MARDARGIDALRLPEIEEGVAHPVLADAGEVAGRGTLTGRCDRDVLRIAAEALQPGPAVALLGAVEFDQWFAEANDVGGASHFGRFVTPPREPQANRWTSGAPSLRVAARKYGGSGWPRRRV